MQHLVTNWHVDRTRADEWEGIWNEMHEVARRMPGFHFARLLRSTEHPGKFVVYSLWDGRECWDGFYNDSTVQDLTRRCFRLIKGPPISEWYDVVREVEAAPAG